MSSGNTALFSRFPALCFLLPWVVGIILAQNINYPVVTAIAGMIALLLIVAFRQLSGKSKTLALQRQLRFPLLAIIIMSAAMELAWLSAPKALSPSVATEGWLIGRVESVNFGLHSTAMRLMLVAHANDSGDSLTDISSKRVTVKISARGCDYSITNGDLLQWKADLKQIKNLGNPAEVDFASIDRNNGITYQQHLEGQDWARIGHRPTWLNRLSNFRNKLEAAVLSTRLNQSTQQLIIALLLGNDDYLDREVRHDFALAGVAHVLALSGLHVGIIVLVVYFLLYPLDYIRLKRLRLLLTILAVIAFDVLTGMSPSVVRATIMLIMVLMPSLIHRRAVPLNSLAVAAIIILAVTPPALFNAGFQFSFITVAFILVFSDAIHRNEPKNRMLAIIYSTVTTTIVASVSTMMLAAYYFNTLNFGSSIIANTLILPIFPIFMFIGIIFLCLAACGIELSIIDKPLHYLHVYIENVVTAINTMGLSSSSWVDVSGITVVLFYLSLICFSIWLLTARGRWLLCAIAMFPLMLCHGIYSELNLPKHGLAIFNSYNSTPILYFCDHKAWLWEPDVATGNTDVETFRKNHSGFIARYHIDTIIGIDTTRVVFPMGVFDPPFACLEGKTMVVAGMGHGKKAILNGTAPRSDLLIISRRYHGDIASIRQLFPADTIVLSGAIYQATRKALRQEMDSSGLRYFDIDNKGAYTRPYMP